MIDNRLIKIKFQVKVSHIEKIKWILNIFTQYSAVFFEESNNKNCIVGYDEKCTIWLKESFWDNIQNDKFAFGQVLNDKMLVVENNKIDYLATAFYFINCLWERDLSMKTDKWQRHEFDESIWKKFNYDFPFLHVNNCFDALINQLGISKKNQPSQLFLSHDIDAVYSAWIEDGFAALKKKKPFVVFKEILKHLSGNPSWFNFLKIAELEKKFNQKSTFFWIPTKKKTNAIGDNADYDITSEKFQEIFYELEKLGASNGLHKSLESGSIHQESKIFPNKIEINRYHYLKFNFVSLINQMNESDLFLDASLGYAQNYGFRNGYSLPFVPFDLKENKPCSFVEIPLVIMDATFSRYQKMSPNEASNKILEFLEDHKINSVISILWHNTHFTDYKYAGYSKVYENILKWSEVNKIKSVSPNELISQYLF